MQDLFSIVHRSFPCPNNSKWATGVASYFHQGYNDTMVLVSIDPAGYPTVSLAVLLTAGTAQISSRCFNVAFASQ